MIKEEFLDKMQESINSIKQGYADKSGFDIIKTEGDGFRIPIRAI